MLTLEEVVYWTVVAEEESQWTTFDDFLKALVRPEASLNQLAFKESWYWSRVRDFRKLALQRMRLSGSETFPASTLAHADSRAAREYAFGAFLMRQGRQRIAERLKRSAP